MDVFQLALTWAGWSNSEKLSLTCMQNQSQPTECKSSQVNPSAST